MLNVVFKESGRFYEFEISYYVFVAKIIAYFKSA